MPAIPLSTLIVREAAPFFAREDAVGRLLAEHICALADLVRRVETPGGATLSVEDALDRMACDTDRDGRPIAIMPGIDFFAFAACE